MSGSLLPLPCCAAHPRVLLADEPAAAVAAAAAAPPAAQRTAALCAQMVEQLRPAKTAQRATVIKALLDVAHGAALNEWPRMCDQILELVCTLHVEIDAEKIRYAIQITVLH